MTKRNAQAIVAVTNTKTAIVNHVISGGFNRNLEPCTDRSNSEVRRRSDFGRFLLGAGCILLVVGVVISDSSNNDEEPAAGEEPSS